MLLDIGLIGDKINKAPSKSAGHQQSIRKLGRA